jgi:hypothetical protein
MKNQVNISPPKVNNSTVTDLHDNQGDEISNNELKNLLTMINKIKEDMYKHPNEFKEDTNEQLNKLKDNSNKKLNKIRKTM